MLRKLISDSKLSARELKLRSSLLLRAESAVRRQNSNADRQFNMAINKFSIMVRLCILHWISHLINAYSLLLHCGDC